MLLLRHRLSFWLAINVILSCAWAPALSARQVTVSCEGFGADRSLSLKQAMDQCRSIASDQVKGASFKVKQVAVESNEENAWHSEVSSEMQVTGLICQQVHEETLQGFGEEYHTNLTCKFDLSQARISSIAPELKVQRITQSDARQIIINSIPACSSIVIRGDRPRAVKCSENPQSVLIYYGLDKQMIIRAKGYLPKTIDIPEQTDSTETEILNALLVRY
jgi:hypothetical protein